MNAPVLTQIEQIEESFSRLSRREQLWLLERLVHHLHESTIREQQFAETALAAMAVDPEIQQELHKIEAEFASTSADGLKTA